VGGLWVVLWGKFPQAQKRKVLEGLFFGGQTFFPLKGKESFGDFNPLWGIEGISRDLGGAL